MTSAQPIGIFDSGVGGLSIARQLNQQLPNECLVYYADQYHLPYGNKTEAFLKKRALSVSKFLIEQGAKAIVVACNTATAITIQELRANLNLPIIGIEPGLKPASLYSKNQRVGVLATTQTLESKSFKNLLQRFSDKTIYICQACPGLAQKIEENIEHNSTLELLSHYLAPLLDFNIDTLVLGCTHYSYLIPMIQRIIGHDILIIEPSLAVSRQIERRLSDHQLLNLTQHQVKDRFLSSALKTESNHNLEQLWKVNIDIAHSPIE